MWPRLLPGEKYLLVAESVKASHMGYFIRGRREGPADAECEDRTIIPSHGEAEGVMADTDFYRHPGMRNTEVAAKVVDALGRRRHRLVCANLAATDMVGHLLPTRFDAAIESHEATDRAVTAMAGAALANGYGVVTTADHGNIEDDSPSHSLNDVLSTVIGAQAGEGTGRLTPEPRHAYQARLFDVGWTLARILGVSDRVSAVRQRPAPDGVAARFQGRPITERH
jgi:bisphosphoglycerate-independent phosphoglycerate mutase (AlkP superfamily)